MGCVVYPAEFPVPDGTHQRSRCVTVFMNRTPGHGICPACQAKPYPGVMIKPQRSPAVVPAVSGQDPDEAVEQAGLELGAAALFHDRQGLFRFKGRLVTAI